MFVWETNLSTVSEGWEGGKSDRRTDVGRTAPHHINYETVNNGTVSNGTVSNKPHRTAPHYPRAKRKQNECTWRTPRNTSNSSGQRKRHSRVSRAHNKRSRKNTYTHIPPRRSAGQETKTSSHSSPPTSLRYDITTMYLSPQPLLAGVVCAIRRAPQVRIGPAAALLLLLGLLLLLHPRVEPRVRWRQLRQVPGVLQLQLERYYSVD